ncbi:MAG: hypothetical protein RXR30_02565 [Nitrososphaeria archaeon]
MPNNAKSRKKATLLWRNVSILLRMFVKTTGVCPVCRKYVKLNMIKFTRLSCNSTFGGDVTSSLIIMKEGLSLWNVKETLNILRVSLLMNVKAQLVMAR